MLLSLCASFWSTSKASKALQRSQAQAQTHLFHIYTYSFQLRIVFNSFDYKLKHKKATIRLSLTFLYVSLYVFAHTNKCARIRRDQNFGLNELAAIQDVRNEYNLQDITDEPPASAQTTNDRGKFHRFIQILHWINVCFDSHNFSTFNLQCLRFSNR